MSRLTGLFLSSLLPVDELLVALRGVARPIGLEEVLGYASDGLDFIEHLCEKPGRLRPWR